MQISKICDRSHGAIQRLNIWSQLDQISRHKTGCEPKVAKHVNQEPARVAAGTSPQLQGLLAGLNARREADDILNLLLQLTVETDEEINRRMAVLERTPRNVPTGILPAEPPDRAVIPS
jgi:hypothetical protein